MYFDRILTEFDRRRVESYLGLKYSLNVTIKATGIWKDYLASEGDSIWDSQTDKYFNQAYHQMITNEFRALWGYGKGVPSATELQSIMKQVYSKYPLPPGYGF